MECATFSLEGLDILLDTISEVKALYNPELRHDAIIANKYRGTKAHKEVHQAFKKNAPCNKHMRHFAHYCSAAGGAHGAPLGPQGHGVPMGPQCGFHTGRCAAWMGGRFAESLKPLCPPTKKNTHTHTTQGALGVPRGASRFKMGARREGMGRGNGVSYMTRRVAVLGVTLGDGERDGLDLGGHVPQGRF